MPRAANLAVGLNALQGRYTFLADRMRVIHGAVVVLLVFFVSCSAPRANSRADKLVVNKSKRQLLLYQGENVIARYRIALGHNPEGPKMRKGDGRTPEGTYSISGRNAASAFHKSLKVSYPNAADRERARRRGVDPGGDIMIHGLPNGRGFVGAAHRLIDWTDGCIAVTNAEIEEIWSLVTDGTLVQINP